METAESALAFDRALFNGKLLNEESMKILLHTDKGYCCGLMDGKVLGYNHTGGGFTATSRNEMLNTAKFGHLYVILLEHC